MNQPLVWNSFVLDCARNLPIYLFDDLDLETFEDCVRFRCQQAAESESHYRQMKLGWVKRSNVNEDLFDYVIEWLKDTK